LLDMAAANRNASDGVIFHSDRGCQFTSEAFNNHIVVKLQFFLTNSYKM